MKALYRHRLWRLQKCQGAYRVFAELLNHVVQVGARLLLVVAFVFLRLFVLAVKNVCIFFFIVVHLNLLGMQVLTLLLRWRTLAILHFFQITKITF